MTRAGPFSPVRLVGISSPLIVWALHFLLVYVLQGLACAEGWQLAEWAGLQRVVWWQLLATAVAYAIVAVLGARAWRLRASLPNTRADADVRRRRFTASLAVATAVLAAIALAFTTLPILLLPTCA